MNSYLLISKIKNIMVNLDNDLYEDIINIIMMYHTEFILKDYLSKKSYKRNNNYNKIISFVNWEKYSIYPENFIGEGNYSKFIIMNIKKINFKNYIFYNSNSEYYKIIQKIIYKLYKIDLNKYKTEIHQNEYKKLKFYFQN